MTLDQGLASGALPESDPLYAPGLKRRSRKNGACARLWMPTQKDIAGGYAPKSISFDSHVSELEIANSCRKYWCELEAWRKGVARGPEKFSLAWLIDRYLGDDVSPFQKLGPRSARSYTQCCKEIRASIGDRLIGFKQVGGFTVQRILGEDILRWHGNWSTRKGKPTPSRARHNIVMLRILAKYAVALGVPGAAGFRTILSDLRFPQPAARTMAPSRSQVVAIVGKALEMGLRSVAITTLAQFELIERRTHIIGLWDKGAWRLGWVWNGLSGTTLTYQQTKVGIVERAFDLLDTPLLLDLILKTPEHQRVGPIIVCERTGQPWRERHYADAFREVARAAGVPDNVWSMDMRAGGTTEADGITGITDRELQDAGGWKDPRTKDRYRRNRQRNAQNVVRLRQRHAGNS